MAIKNVEKNKTKQNKNKQKQTKTKKNLKNNRQGSYTLKQTLIIKGKSLKDILITAKFSGQKI